MASKTFTGIPWDGRTAYERWVEDDLELDLHRGYSANNLRTVPLKPWTERGISAAFYDIIGAESLAGHLMRLQAVTAALARALTPAQIAEVIVDHGIAAVGALAGSLIVASMSRVRRKGMVLAAGSILFPSILVVFAFSRSPVLSLAALSVVGVAFQATITQHVHREEAVAGSVSQRRRDGLRRVHSQNRPHLKVT